MFVKTALGKRAATGRPEKTSLPSKDWSFRKIRLNPLLAALRLVR
ncbi:hypothetical protein HMPREF1249_1126 [Jonquetella sp. BV3C21]|nr:hypothetical protein HMPREF1249_1126 [Jonquetella sp. BV3C21]